MTTSGVSVQSLLPLALAICVTQGVGVAGADRGKLAARLSGAHQSIRNAAG